MVRLQLHFGILGAALTFVRREIDGQAEDRAWRLGQTRYLTSALLAKEPAR